MYFIMIQLRYVHTKQRRQQRGEGGNVHIAIAIITENALINICVNEIEQKLAKMWQRVLCYVILCVIHTGYKMQRKVTDAQINLAKAKGLIADLSLYAFVSDRDR